MIKAHVRSGGGKSGDDNPQGSGQNGIQLGTNQRPVSPSGASCGTPSPLCLQLAPLSSLPSSHGIFLVLHTNPLVRLFPVPSNSARILLFFCCAFSSHSRHRLLLLSVHRVCICCVSRARRPHRIDLQHSVIVTARYPLHLSLVAIIPGSN